MSTSSEHYFTAEPAAADERRSLPVTLAGRSVTVTTAPGIFCPDRIDAGTAVLFDCVPPPPPAGNLLDLGCGWGPIALTLALLSPAATVWGVDVNRRALGLLADNARDLGLLRVHGYEPDDVPPEVSFDLIWSNPPIRIGKSALHELLLRWLPRLSVGGSAYLVVQKNLGSDSLQRWLLETLNAGYAVSRACSSKGFRVLRVDRLH